MVETATEEKVPLEAKNKPFMVCGFIGAFWNLSYGSEDHLGSTRMVLDENGTVKEALMYQPYGAVSDVQGITVAGTDPLRQKFTTKEFDEEGDANGAPGIDAYHFGFRVYDPEIGIFLSSDPMDVFWNSYSYNGGDPVNFVDPYGLSPIDITVGSVLQDLSYLEGVGMQLAMDLESIASLFNGIASTTVSFERTANNITMIGDLSLSEYAYVNYMETAFSNSLPPISLTNYTGAIATPAVTPIATTVSNEIVQPARSMLWSGIKDVGYGTAQVTFGVFLLSTALAQEAAPTGITQATGLVTGAAGAWYLVGGVGSLGIGAGKISLGLQNPDLMDNVFPTSPPILDMLYTPGYPQATEDLIRGCTRNDKK